MNLQVMSKRSMVVVVTDWDDAPRAIRAASDLLDLRNPVPRAGRPGDEVLGVWCRSPEDGALPVPSNCEGASEEGLAFRESFAFPGQWSLCWLDGPLFEAAPSTEARRARLLEFLARRAPESGGTFAPVFEANASRVSMLASLRELRHRHPDFVRDTLFIDHGNHGLRTAEGF